MIGKYAVLSHNRYDVRSDADCYQVQQRNQMMKFDAVADSECLHEFKTYSAARKMFVRIGVVFALGVQYSYGRGQHFIGYVVVADDEVDAFFPWRMQFRPTALMPQSSTIISPTPVSEA